MQCFLGSMLLTGGLTAGAATAISVGAPARDDAARLSMRHIPLSIIEGTLLTTAGDHYEGNQVVFERSVEWHARTRLLPEDSISGDGTDAQRGLQDDGVAWPAPYLACTQRAQSNRAALVRLRSLLGSQSAVRTISGVSDEGMCVLATATPSQARAVAAALDDSMDDTNETPTSENAMFEYWAPFPPALKVAPGLLRHEGIGNDARDSFTEERTKTHSSDHSSTRADEEPEEKDDLSGDTSERLRTTHGERVKFPRESGASPVQGLEVELAPGVLPVVNRRNRDADGGRSGASDRAVACFESSADLVDEWLGELMSRELDLHDTNFWSSAGAEELEEANGSVRRPGQSAASLSREWGRAAHVLHDLSSGGGPVIGDACSWDEIRVFHTDNDLLTIRGIDHLLPEGRGVGGTAGEEADELQVSCFMGLLSYLAARPEVLRVSTSRKLKLLNAAAYANVQSATLTETPLTDAGLDGMGEVIQILDTGLDYNSCFFIGGEGEEPVAHGHYFEEIGVTADAMSSWYPTFELTMAEIFTGGNFEYDLDKRKIVQYIALIRQDSENGTHPYGPSWMSTYGNAYPWVSPDEYAEDDAGGHGTHTAGSAAGSVVSDPVPTQECTEGRNLSCVGGCVDVAADGEDDLVSSWEIVYSYVGLDAVDLDQLCPKYDCDGLSDEYCLSDDETENLAQHGGVARGAKLAIFDILDEYYGIGLSMAGNGVFDPAIEAGSKLHSNSWGASTFCEYQSSDVLYDYFMYTHPENLLLFAAGNDGDYSSYYDCTLGSPAVSKNSLTIGASTSGPGRLTWTAEDGDMLSAYSDRAQDIDIMAYFSSAGPTLDGRIKPDVVAPGDAVYSAAGSGTGNYTCRLWSYPGTSMSTPLVAGAAALIRQYFRNETFYAHDVESRGYCESFGCEPYSPSGATVKAMLVNSANLMGNSSEPDGVRGFGRVHLEAGMPLNGDGNLTLFVADSNTTSTPELTLTEYSFEVASGTDLDLRATLAWIDPPATALSAIQLVHDLDLAVYSPGGTRYSMWRSGGVDSVNNIERVIVPAAALRTDPGLWGVRVWAKRLVASETQSYSLVVTGPIGPPDGDDSNDIARVPDSSTLSSWS